MSETYTTRYTLLERAKNQNDSQAWEELIGIYKNYIYIIVRSMNINEHDAQDIMQLVVVKLWKSLPEYEVAPEKYKFRHWVSRITRNEVISFIRRQKSLMNTMNEAAKEATISYLNVIQLPEVDSTAEREWKVFITNMASKNMEQFFTSRALESFQMYSKGIAVSEIAETLSVKEISVYKYISRIKFRLIDEITLLKEEFSF